MVYFLVTIIVFLLSVTGHIGYHRLKIHFKKKSFKTIGIFFVGFLLNCTILGKIYFDSLQLTNMYASVWLYPLPFSGAFFYIMLFFSYIIYSASPYLGQEGPTSKILTFLQKHPYKTKKQIVDAFTDNDTILDRIRDLVQVGWVLRKGSYMTVAPKGALLARLLLWYRSLLQFKRGG